MAESHTPGSLTLYGCWRSSSSHRMQIGLRLKALPFTYVPVSLDRREQETPAFRAINPGGQVPVLMVDGEVFTHAFAMLEMLDERFPDSGIRLMPADPVTRARVREITQLVACLMQPFQLPWSIRKRAIEAFQLDRLPGGPDAACRRFSTLQIGGMMAELNRLVARSGGAFSVGDTPTMADCAVIPQLVASVQYGIDLNAYAALSRVFESCSRHPVFQAAQPDRMVDAPSSPTPAVSGASASPAPAPAALAEVMAYKDSDAATHAYLSTVANRPLPGLDVVREEAFRRFGPVATKMSARDVCLFLRWLASLMQARSVIEIGVFTGSSSLALLDGMPADGRLLAFDVSREYTDVARHAWSAAGFSHRAELRLEDAATGVKKLHSDPAYAGRVDLAYIDGANTQYRENLEDLLPLMRSGGVLVFDNVLWKGRVAHPAPDDDAQTIHLRELNAFLRDDPRVESCVIETGDGLALVRKR